MNNMNKLSEQENIMNYYKENILTKIDPTLFKLDYNCFGCYYRKFLLNINDDNCLFGIHKIKKEKWMSCHLLHFKNPNGDLLKLYNIVNQNTKLFLMIYQNSNKKKDILDEYYEYYYNYYIKK